ncbi:hypothetical protein AK812_SmicGene37944 [Symbiodinium microadriaticum]|uniref:Uncharacterized protein n=1 Tax=Symbiodinium microadriaticum TaxID=2951 RepID=A0A1Q9CEZ5_SYMMI|nr:hypothetical protein AK812_SmicGene37944 [Symbiodinium microadriaticum]
MFYGADTLQAACAYATMDVVDELLKQEHLANDKAVLSKGLCLAATNWGCSPQLVLKLVEYGADVNFQLRASHFALSYQVVSKYFALRYRLGVRSPISVMMYHLDGLTPLMACLFTGQYDGAAALLASGARPELRNSRGWNAEDIIKGQTIPGWLKNGMAGQLSDCEDVASLALGNEGFVVETEPVRLMNLAGKLKRSIAAEQGRLEMRRRLQGQSSNTGSSSDFHKIAPSSEEPLTNPLTGSQSAQAAQDETLARHLAVQVKRLKVVEFMRTLLRRNPEVRCSASEALQAEIFIQQQSQEVLDDDEGDLLVVNRRPLKRQKDGEKEGDKEADKEGDKGAADLQQNASEGSPVNQQRKSDKTSRDLSYQPDSPRHSKPEPGSPPASQSARKEKEEPEPEHQDEENSLSLPGGDPKVRIPPQRKRSVTALGNEDSSGPGRLLQVPSQKKLNKAKTTGQLDSSANGAAEEADANGIGSPRTSGLQLESPRALTPTSITALQAPGRAGGSPTPMSPSNNGQPYPGDSDLFSGEPRGTSNILFGIMLCKEARVL